MVEIDQNDPLSHKPIVEREAVRILRRRGDLIITETKHGFVCANAGIDLSNVARGQAALLPEDSDRSARRIVERVRHNNEVSVGVIISDTFGRPWRRGVTDVAIGCAGVAAADLVCGKAEGIPVALVRGVDSQWLRESSIQDEVVRSPSEDLFR